jgi:hypothetical protein
LGWDGPAGQAAAGAGGGARATGANGWKHGSFADARRAYVAASVVLAFIGLIGLAAALALLRTKPGAPAAADLADRSLTCGGCESRFLPPSLIDEAVERER